MKERIHQMLGSGIHSKELAIQHVRQPGDRVVVINVDIDKGPLDAIPGDPISNGLVFEHVIGIIILHEIVVPDGPKEGEGDQP